MEAYQVYSFDGRMPVYQYEQYGTQVDSHLTVTDILWPIRVYVFAINNNDENNNLFYGYVRIEDNIAEPQTPGCCGRNGELVEACCCLSYLCQQQNTSMPVRRIWDYMCGYYGIAIDCKVLKFLRDIRENYVTPI
jgi:hypothetical protein